MANQPFSYYGGKQRLASKIIPYIPKHTVYAEPFCGGASVFFKKPWPDVLNNDHYREYLNDQDEDIVNFFKVLSERGEELAERLSVLPYSEALYRDSKAYGGGDSLLRAQAFFINISQAFSSKKDGGWRRGVFSENLQATWEKARNLYPYIKRMGSVGLACQDTLKFISQYDAPQTFFYCDPPYPGTDQGHYEGYSQLDFERLVELATKSSGSFLISCYNQDRAFDFNVWRKTEFQSHCSARGRVGYDRSQKADESKQNRKRIECLYYKPSAQPRAEIQALYDSGRFDCFTGNILWDELGTHYALDTAQ